MEPSEEIAELSRAVLSLLFVADRPAPLDRLAAALDVTQDRAREAVERLEARLADMGLQVQAVAGGYQLCTRPEHSDLVRRFLQREQGESLSRGALETLAIVAYKQPATRGDIEQIRGSSSDWHVERLLERQLIRVVGRRESVGRPMLFGTTERFLRYFGLRGLSDLPPAGEVLVQSMLDPRE